MRIFLVLFTLIFAGCSSIPKEAFKEVPWNLDPELASLQGIAKITSVRNNCDFNPEQTQKINRVIGELLKVLTNQIPDNEKRIEFYNTFIEEGAVYYSSDFDSELCSKYHNDLDNFTFDY